MSASFITKWLDFTFSKLEKFCRLEWRYEIKCDIVFERV